MNLKRFLLLLSFIVGYGSTSLWASHLFGGEIFYTYISGNTYKVTLVLYGDCGGTATAFQGLPTATPNVVVLNNTTQIQTLLLTPQSGNGVNVSPVCPDEINNTTCDGGTLPGVKRFTYSANVVLNGQSTNWVFRFNGQFSNNTLAGRSNSITNIFIPGGGSLLCLEATLNNTQAVNNSSPTYTSIPTPFFCMNFPQEYNQGAVDPNGDSLTFSLVSGLAANGNNATNVTYVNPYTAQNPIGVTASTFSFNNTNGQLSFTPNIPQQALVVGKVSEYRNGVLRGTSMREMIIVVLNNCQNSPPNDIITNPVNGTVVGGTTFKVCKFNGTASFNINVSDINGDNVTLSTEGVPTGAIVSIAGNGTNAPIVSLSWNVTNVAIGNYTFYINYSDDGCPLATKKTVAYTIQVLPKPTISVTLITPSTCISKAVFSVGSNGIDAPYTLNVTQASTPLLTVPNITNTIIDSLPSGTYNFRLTNASGCYVDTTIAFSHMVDINQQVAWTEPKCKDGNTGSISITATGSNLPLMYAINANSYTAADTFNNLTPGTYVVHVKDNIGCTKDTTITITNPAGIQMGIALQKPVCRPVNNGQVTINAGNGNSPYQFAINNGVFGNNNTFIGLAPGTHIIHIRDSENCLKDSSIVLIDSFLINMQATITKPLCFGDANGNITVIPTGATAPYVYALGSSSTFTSNNFFNNLAIGTYTIKIKDANQCEKDTTITITQPNKLYLTLTTENVKCNGGNTGSVNISGIGGTPTYQYGINTGGYLPTNHISGISAGTHTIKIKDNNGCEHDTIITITQPAAALSFGNFEIVSPTCEGFANGSVTLVGTGGTPTYTYMKNGQGFSPSNIFSEITEGEYTFTVKDNNGCEIDTYVVIKGYPHILLDSISFKEPSCFEYTDGAIIIHASGGVLPLNYSINDSDNWSGSATLSNVRSGAHTIHIRDKEGCLKDSTVILTQPTEVAANATSGSDCNGITDGGFITLTPSGGTEPYTYKWMHNAQLNSSKIVQLENGDYTVIVTDSKGCMDTASINLLLSACCKPFIPNAFSPNNDGNNDEYRVLYLADMSLKELQIYNRYGQRVFSTTSQSKAWDGTYNGKPLDAGTYFYHIRITCGNITQKELIFDGDISLIR